MPVTPTDTQARPEIYFASFADHRYKKSLQRIKEEAKEMGVFKEIFCWNEDDLDDEFWEKHKHFILHSTRGFGYYIWKPQVVLQALRKMPENAVLVFADAGCQLNKEGIQRLYEYADMATNHPSGIVGFNTTFPIRDWTKISTLLYLRVTELEKTLPQHLGGVHVMCNCAQVRYFVENWLQLCENYEILDDRPSQYNNLPGFKDHRHDQSIFSILFHRYNGLSIPDETWWEPNWDDNKKYPIHAKRIRT